MSIDGDLHRRYSEKVSAELSQKERASLTPGQTVRLEDGLVRTLRSRDYDLDKVTPEMIRGDYEMVVIHTYPLNAAAY